MWSHRHDNSEGPRCSSRCAISFPGWASGLVMVSASSLISRDGPTHHFSSPLSSPSLLVLSFHSRSTTWARKIGRDGHNGRKREGNDTGKKHSRVGWCYRLTSSLHGHHCHHCHLFFPPHLHASMAAPTVHSHRNLWLAKLVNKVGSP